MEYSPLGRTGLQVTVMGLGCGGHSRLGQSYGLSEEDSAEVVRTAITRGINFIDTAEVYGTEAIVGQGLSRQPRESFVLSTKFSPTSDGNPINPAKVRSALENSLRRLQLDYVDIYHLHGLNIKHYDYAVSEFVPELLKLRDEGKIRFLGITEAFASDPGHTMLQRAVQDDCWDVMMVGFNILNQSARERVLATAAKKNIGILVMFVVRRALTSQANLNELLISLESNGLVDAKSVEQLLNSMISEGRAASLQDIAYRFCRYEPGVHVVLSGTGNLAHLDSNAASLDQPPLPPEDVARLRELFKKIDGISGN